MDLQAGIFYHHFSFYNFLKFLVIYSTNKVQKRYEIYYTMHRMVTRCHKRSTLLLSNIYGFDVWNVSQNNSKTGFRDNIVDPEYSWCYFESDTPTHSEQEFANFYQNKKIIDDFDPKSS